MSIQVFNFAICLFICYLFLFLVWVFETFIIIIAESDMFLNVKENHLVFKIILCFNVHYIYIIQLNILFNVSNAVEKLLICDQSKFVCNVNGVTKRLKCSVYQIRLK